MVIDMNETKLSTIAQLREILDGTCEVRFERVEDDAKRYAFIESVLRRLGYRRRSLGVFPRARVRKFPTAFFRATGNNRTDVCLSSDRIWRG